jgi:hypothetical protein
MAYPGCPSRLFKINGKDVKTMFEDLDVELTNPGALQAITVLKEDTILLAYNSAKLFCVVSGKIVQVTLPPEIGAIRSMVRLPNGKVLVGSYSGKVFVSEVLFADAASASLKVHETLFGGDQPSAECGINLTKSGKSESMKDLHQVMRLGLSRLCQGDEIIDLDALSTCGVNKDATLRILIAQGFAVGSQVIEIRRPCHELL